MQKLHAFKKISTDEKNKTIFPAICEYKLIIPLTTEQND